MNPVNTFAAWTQSHPYTFALIIIWTIVWKGLALWKAASLQQKWWFIALFLINTFGILEIVYLYGIVRKYKVEVVES